LSVFVKNKNTNFTFQDFCVSVANLQQINKKGGFDKIDSPKTLKIGIFRVFLDALRQVANLSILI